MWRMRCTGPRRRPWPRRRAPVQIRQGCEVDDRAPADFLPDPVPISRGGMPIAHQEVAAVPPRAVMTLLMMPVLVNRAKVMA